MILNELEAGIQSREILPMMQNRLLEGSPTEGRRISNITQLHRLLSAFTDKE